MTIRHRPNCSGPNLHEWTGRRGDRMQTCDGCGRVAPVGALPAAPPARPARPDPFPMLTPPKEAGGAQDVDLDLLAELARRLNVPVMRHVPGVGSTILAGDPAILNGSSKARQSRPDDTSPARQSRQGATGSSAIETPLADGTRQ